MDNDGSNVIDTGEVRRLLATLTPSVDHASTAFEERVLQLMSRMDADGNGVVTCEVRRLRPLGAQVSTTLNPSLPFPSACMHAAPSTTAVSC